MGLSKSQFNSISVFLVSIRSLGRVCQDAETREVLARVEKQVTLLFLCAYVFICGSVFLCVQYFSVGLCFSMALYFSVSNISLWLCISLFLQVSVLSQSTGRVASSSEQYGAVQQEARVATAIEVIDELLQVFFI